MKPIIYQVFTRLFGNTNTNRVPGGTLEQNGSGKFNDFTPAVLRRIRQLGVTHVWYTGIVRHATTTDYQAFGLPRQHAEVVKGRAGSPYAIADYYDVDPDLAVDVDRRMEEMLALLERTHRAGMGFIMDFVPNHVAREYCSVNRPDGVADLGQEDDSTKHFSVKNNFYYCWGLPFEPEGGCGSYSECPAKATGNDCFSNRPGKNDWYETVKLNYGIDYCDAGGRSEHFSPLPDTWVKMTDILLFWAEKGVDGFRCDMAEMVPPAFWRYALEKVKDKYPGICFIGEVYNPGSYREYISAGFDYLYDKVGMYDCMCAVMRGDRWASDITAQWQSTDDISVHMLYFLENHDEQRIASRFLCGNPRMGIPGLVVSVLLRSNPFMLYAGQEFGEPGMDREGFSGQDGRTTIFDYWSLETLCKGYYDRCRLTTDERGLEDYYKKVLNMSNREKTLREGGFFDLMYVNPHLAEKNYAFLRHCGNELVLVVASFSAQYGSCKVFIPRHAFEWMGIEDRETVATDLLTGHRQEVRLEADGCVDVRLEPYGAAVLKMDL